MSTVYYVIKQSTCPVCKGNRIVTHPSWAAFWETNHNPTDENIEKWFRDEDYDFPPDEEIPCMECGGTGVISQMVDISEALQFIEDRLENLETHVMSTDRVIKRMVNP